MRPTQRSIIYFSVLSFVGLFVAVLVAILVTTLGAYFFAGDLVADPNMQDRLVWATMALTLVLWLPFNLWCRRQIVCSVCQGSLFQTLWNAEWDFARGEWHSNVRTTCPKCSAQLP